MRNKGTQPKQCDRHEVCFIISPYQTVESSVIFSSFALAEAYMLGLIVSTKGYYSGHLREFKMYWRHADLPLGPSTIIKYSVIKTNETSTGFDLIVSRCGSAFGVPATQTIHLLTSLGG